MADGMTSSKLRVLIIGAGSAGLLMAHVGIDATVFEQDGSPTARPRDWNFGIYWAQSRLEEILPPAIRSLLDTAQTDPSHKRSPHSTLPILKGTTGEVLKNLEAPFSIRLRRRAWLDLIRRDIDARFSKRLASVLTSGDEVTATFTDGTTEHANLLIGAEGAHSIARDFLFRSSPQDAVLLKSPVVASIAIAKFDREIALALRKVHPTYHMTFEPEGRFTWASTHDCTASDPADWTFLIMMTWHSEDDTGLDSDDTILDDLYKRAEGLAYPFKESFTSIPRGTKFWHARLTYWPTKPWDGGGLVTLAGDAAHAMTFHRGQGLGNAITDAAELQTRLKAMKSQTPEELKKAVLAYEKEMWPRGLEAVMGNLENTLAVHNWDVMAKSPIFVGGVWREGDKVRVSDQAD
ncbi:hypothetical protein OQA88_8376 [Cercophora sp. LCS_1]